VQNLTFKSFFHNLIAGIHEQGTKAMTPNEMQKALWAAAEKGDKEKIRMLVVAGASVTAEDDLGRTALNIASQYGQADAYKTLLAAREMQELMQAGIAFGEKRERQDSKSKAA
jgi:ankyrin repeat protein